MDLLPTDEQEEIVASVRAVLADRHVMGDPIDDALWSTAVEQGWFALGLPEELGGVGYTAVEEALVFIEIGRVCAPGPFLATTIAARIAAEVGETDLSAALISGEKRAAWAEPEGDGFRFTDHSDAQVTVVVDEDEISVMSLDGVELVDEAALDVLVPLATGPRPTQVLARAVDPAAIRARAMVLAAAALSGIALATTDQSVEYAKDRQQFGQPIGGFQAVKHRCADMAVRADLASSQVRWAALSIAGDLPDAGAHAAAAAIVASNAAITNAQTNIQNHGGIGFTWEHTAHRFVTRARMWGALLGGVRAHQATLLAAPTPD